MCDTVYSISHMCTRIALPECNMGCGVVHIVYHIYTPMCVWRRQRWPRQPNRCTRGECTREPLFGLDLQLKRVAF